MDFAAVIQAAREGGQFVKIEDSAYCIVPENAEFKDLEHLLPRPAYVRAKLTAETVDGFATYFNRFKRPESLIFASRDKGHVQGVLDYHIPAAPETMPEPAHGAHRITYKPVPSIEWERWSKIDGAGKTQGDFAKFIEENLIDIVRPDAATVLEISRHLQAKKKVEFQSGIRLSDGSHHLEYVETVEGAGKGKIDIPEKIVLGIPVYYGEDKWEIEVWLRYRIDGGRLIFTLEMHRRQYVEDHAFKSVVEKLEKACGESKAIFAG